MNQNQSSLISLNVTKCIIWVYRGELPVELPFRWLDQGRLRFRFDEALFHSGVYWLRWLVGWLVVCLLKKVVFTGTSIV